MVNRAGPRLKQVAILAAVALASYGLGTVGAATLVGKVAHAIQDPDIPFLSGVDSRNPCPPDAPRVVHHLVATTKRVDVTGNGDFATLRHYVLLEDEEAVKRGVKPLEPVVIRANVGDCIDVYLTNRLAHPAGVHPHLVKFFSDSDGSFSGYNEDSNAPPGGTRVYHWYAEREHISFFHTHASHEDMASGLFGALIVEPKGATWLDPETGTPLRSGAAAAIVRPDGDDYREFVLFFHDLFLPQAFEAINYRSAHMDARLARDPDHANVTSSAVHGDPPTPTLRAYPGDPVKLRVIGAGPENFHVFHIHGHQWLQPLGGREPEPADAQTFGTSEVFTFDLLDGAGGNIGATGDFLYHCHVLSHMHRGMWGIFRVEDGLKPDLVPLPDRVA